MARDSRTPTSRRSPPSRAAMISVGRSCATPTPCSIASRRSSSRLRPRTSPASGRYTAGRSPAHGRSPVAERLCSPSGEPLTDLANAERFVRAHTDSMRYVKPSKTWLVFDGRRWARDTTGEAERRAKDTLREMLVEAAALEDAKERTAGVQHALHSMNGAGL